MVVVYDDVMMVVTTTTASLTTITVTATTTTPLHTTTTTSTSSAMMSSPTTAITTLKSSLFGVFRFTAFHSCFEYSFLTFSTFLISSFYLHPSPSVFYPSLLFIPDLHDQISSNPIPFHFIFLVFHQEISRRIQYSIDSWPEMHRFLTLISEPSSTFLSFKTASFHRRRTIFAVNENALFCFLENVEQKRQKGL